MLEEKQMEARISTILILTLCYPIWQGIRLHLAGNDGELVFDALQHYRISIWLVWVIWAAMSVWYKWSRRHNRLFKITYGYIVVSCIVYGYFYFYAISLTAIPSPFSDNYTAGFFAAMLDAVVLCALTAFLQGAVWWFTRRMHRE